ncbi:2OG-Fe(II) oxygenase [Parasphingopyxis sp.]|uniref:2OG-Fe(II) oxygenase n=1 Tax=Parasphingopyxis sp. TaxID=1920299 RepID=UPI00262E2C6F|nr:2OG-Fe(II) oxygenase [Parasphingopyxis sp.]
MSLTEPSVLAARNREIMAHIESHDNIQRVPTRNIDIYQCRDFLNDAECQLLVEKIDRDARPSTLLSTTDDTEFRTSSSTDFDRQEPAIDAIEEKIVRFMGIPKENGETIQGQRYEVGQQFKPHNDWFYDNQDYWKTEKDQGGQRTWTAMVFLNDTQVGGATRFKRLGKMFHAEKGKLLCWNNLTHEGVPNEWSLHQGMKVRKGVKYIITKWFRELPWAYGGQPSQY